MAYDASYFKTLAKNIIRELKFGLDPDNVYEESPTGLSDGVYFLNGQYYDRNGAPAVGSTSTQHVFEVVDFNVATWPDKDDYYVNASGYITFRDATESAVGSAEGFAGFPDTVFYDPRKMFDKMDASVTADDRVQRAKKIEFMSMLVEQVVNVDQSGITACFNAGYLTDNTATQVHFANTEEVGVSIGFLDNSDNTPGQGSQTWAFKSPTGWYHEGDLSYWDDLAGEIGYYGPIDHYIEYAGTSEHGHAKSSDILGYGSEVAITRVFPSFADKQYDMDPQYGTYPSSVHTIGTGRLIHNGLQDVDRESDDTGAFQYHTYWNQWEVTADFPSFLFWLANLIELLDLSYADVLEDSGIPIFFRGKSYIAATDGAGGYHNIDFDKWQLGQDQINDVVNLDIPDELRDWWSDFFENAEVPVLTAPGTPSLGGPSYTDSSASEVPHLIDIESCEIAVAPLEDESADLCRVEPCAVVPNWTMQDSGYTFFNKRTCEYSIVLHTEDLGIPEDTSSYLLDGVRQLLEKYKKALSLTYKFSPIAETALGPTALDGSSFESTELTENILFDVDMVKNYLKTTISESSLPSIPKDGEYISTVPYERSKLLVIIPANLFDAIPKEYSSIRDVKSASFREMTAANETMVRLKGKEVSKMTEQVSRALNIYAVQYAAWIFTGQNSGTADFGNLKLSRESDNITLFGAELLLVLIEHGFDYNSADFIDIVFNPETYEILYISAGSEGCASIVLDQNIWSSRIESSLWNNKRTLAYIHRLPDMWNDVTAREPLAWSAFIEKYTVDLLSSAELNALLPETFECITEGTASTDTPIFDLGPFNAVLEGIAADLFSLPEAYADKLNKMLCEGEEFERLDEDLNSFEDLLKRAGDAALGEFFAGDQMAEMLPTIIKHFQGGGSLGGLWSEILDKYGWCGILALIDIVLACILKGMGFEDGLLGIVKSGLDSLDPNKLNKMFTEFTDDLQDSIAAAVAEKLGQATTSEPGGVEGPPGSFSVGGEKTTTNAILVLEGRGKAIADAAGGSINVVVTDLNVDDARAFASYQSSLPRTDSDALNKRELNEILMTHIGYGIGPILNIKSYVGDGTIGTGTLDYIKMQEQAYKEAILEIVPAEDLLDMLMKLPGAQLIADLLSAFDCIVPIYFSPPIDEWFKFKNLDYCRLKGNFVWPALPKIYIPDFMEAMMKALLQVIQDLIVKAILALLTTILSMLLNAACNILALGGELLASIGDEDGLRDKLRTVCGFDSLSDEELDDILAGMISALSGCDPEGLRNDSQEFVNILSVILTDQQLVELITGNATDETLKMIKNVMAFELPDSYGECLSSESNISDLFDSIGKIIPDKFKKLPTETPLPVSPSLCRDQDALDSFYEAQCALMSQKTELTSEQCAQQIENLKNRAKEDLDQLLCAAQNGPQEWLDAQIPDIISFDPNNPGLLPNTLPIEKAVGDQIFGMHFKNLESAHELDLSKRQGYLDMVLSNKVGAGYNQHIEQVEEQGLTNNFPDTVASHLQELLAQKEQPERFLAEGKNFIGWGTSNITTVAAGEWGVDFGRTFVTNIDSQYLGYPEPVITDSSAFEPMLLKNQDLTMEYADYKEDQWYDFTLKYENFQIDPNTDKSVLNDYYKIKIENKAYDGTSNSDWNEGVFGENRTQADVEKLINDASYGNFYDQFDIAAESLDLNIDEYLAIKENPKGALYAKLMMETWKNLLPDSAPHIDSISETLYGAYSNHYYDYIMAEYLSKFSTRLSEGETAFTHGYPTDYSILGTLFAAAEDKTAMEAAITALGITPSANSSLPTKIDLKGSWTSYDGNEWDIPPEVYGGTDSYPAYYMKPAEFDGWAGLYQKFLPPKSGCKPRSTPLCNFSQLKDITAEYYEEKFMDDPRLQQNPDCSPEPPWNKILNKTQASGIEGSLRATVRIYVVEAILKGMPSFSIFQPNSPLAYDDLLLDYIAETMEEGLIDITLGKNFRNPTTYYFKFMEQVVQSFGRKVDLGEILPSSAEQAAIDRLNDTQIAWEELEYPTISSNYWPGIRASSIMAGNESPLSSAGSLTSFLFDAAIDTQKEAEKYAKKVWKKYAGETQALLDSRVLLKRYIKEEMEFINSQLKEDINPPIDGVHNMFLVNNRFILGSLEEGGPLNVARTPSFGATVLGADPEIPMHEDLKNSIVTVYNSEEPDSIEGYFGKASAADQNTYIPFVLEKFIKINELSDKDLNSSPAYIVLSPTDKLIVKRDGEDFLKGVVNIDEWQEYLSTNSAIFSGKFITDFFKSWEFGVRISHVALEYAESTGDLNELGERAIARGYGSTPASFATGHLFDGNAEGQYYRNEVLDKISDISTHSQQQKAFKLQIDAMPFVLIPLVASTKEFNDQITIDSFVSTTLQTLFEQNNTLNCLMSDLIKNPRYEMLFEYSISMQRILSILTIYNIKGFLPSIGSRASDGWWERNPYISSYDLEKGGGRYMGAASGFRVWNFDNLFMFTKGSAMKSFKSFYSARDFVPEPMEELEDMQVTIDTPSFKNLVNVSSRLLSKEIKRPFDKYGNPCPLKEEED